MYNLSWVLLKNMVPFFIASVLMTVLIGSVGSNFSVVTACPPLMTYQDGHCVCNPAFSNLLERGFIRAVFCDQQSATVYAASGTCVTYHNTSSTSEIVIGDCSYVPVRRQHYYLGLLKPLPQNYSDLDNAMCDAFNRQGMLCSSCKSGYGVAVYSLGYPCAECTAKRLYTFLYLMLELVPTTVLYAVVILFRIRASVPPLVGLVYFSHVIINSIKVQIFIHTTMLYSTTRSIHTAWKFAIFFSSIWSLDFFRVWVPPFCVNENLTNVHVALLEYVSAFYPLCLILLTFIVMEMHAYNIRLIVWLWKPFHPCLFRFRKTWNIRYSIVNAFSTFFLLSYFKILSVSFRLLHQTSIYNVNGTHIDEGLYIDPTKQAFDSTTQRCISAFAIFIIFVFSICPVLLLLFYPTRFVQKLLRLCTCRAKHAVHMFVDTYQGCLKDGSQGTRDYRSVSALYFVLRFALLCLYIRDTHLSRSGLTYVVFSLTFIVCSIFIIAFKPYKNQISNYTEFALLFLLGNIGLFVYAWLLFPDTGYAGFITTLYLLPHCAMMCYIAWCALSSYKGKKVLNRIKSYLFLLRADGGNCRYITGSLKFPWLLKRANSKENVTLDIELPDRFINPDNYPQELTTTYDKINDIGDRTASTRSSFTATL